MKTSNRSRWIGPLGLLAAGIMLVAAGVIISFANRADPSSVGSNVDPSDGAARVSLEDTFNAYQNGSAVLVDVRSSGSYQNAHIPGSLSIPLGEIESRVTELNSDDWIITICA